MHACGQHLTCKCNLQGENLHAHGQHHALSSRACIYACNLVQQGRYITCTMTRCLRAAQRLIEEVQVSTSIGGYIDTESSLLRQAEMFEKEDARAEERDERNSWATREQVSNDP